MRVSPARAARLADRAMRRRADGSRDAAARRAWRRLCRAGDRAEQAVVTVVWQEWLRTPGEELWEALSRWQQPQSLAEAAFAAAMDPDRAPAERAAIGRFCTGRGLAPQDAVRRAVFYRLTGQDAQHRAADPDGRLLAVGYGLSDERTRTALRDALASAGDLDIVRVVGGDRRLTAVEREYLSRHLAGRRDWAGLWRFARDLPLAEAVATMELFGDGWHPAGDRDRGMFARLTRANAAAIGRSGEALAAPVVIDVTTDGPVLDGSFSPDGRQLMVAVGDRTFPGYYRGFRVYGLPGGTLLELYDSAGHPPVAIVHLGSAFLVVSYRRLVPAWELVRYAAGQPRVLHRSGYPMTAAAHPAGFVVLEELSLEQRWRLGLYDAAGTVLSDSEVELAYPPSHPVHWSCQVAADPVTGRIVVSGNGLWVLAADGSDVLATAEIPVPCSMACFTAPDSVVAVDRAGNISRYQIAGTRLELRASAANMPSDGAPARLVAIPHRGEIAVWRKVWREGVRYLDAETLADKRPSDDLGAGFRPEFRVCASADGRSQALGVRTGDGHFARVIWGHAAAQQLPARPLGSMGPADLAAATAALQSPVLRPAARQFLRLLRDCLRPRFEADVGLADVRPVPGGDDDVRLAAGEWPG